MAYICRISYIGFVKCFPLSYVFAHLKKYILNKEIILFPVCELNAI